MEYEPCVAYVGNSVSASYVDLVLNVMETAGAQLLAEAYGMLLAAGFTNDEVSKSFTGWNKEDLESPLLTAAVQILKKKDTEGEGSTDDPSLIDKVLDCPTVVSGTATFLREIEEHHVAASILSAALNETFLSALREQRIAGRRGVGVE